MVICLGYEFSPNMMGIQEGYSKNFHIKSIEFYEKFDSLHFFEPSDFTRADVCSENCQLQARLENVISLEKMKQALQKKDQDLAAAQKEA